jgi:hypothetical protein
MNNIKKRRKILNNSSIKFKINDIFKVLCYKLTFKKYINR